jgi:hypothetical protein
MKRAFGWSSDSRAAWPSYRSVALVDTAMAVVAIALAAFVIVSVGLEPIAKARFTEAVNLGAVQRLTLVEHLAVTGRHLRTDVAARSGARSSGAADYERHLSGGFLASVAPQAGKASQAAESPWQVRAGIVDGAVLVVGRMREFDASYALPMIPAIAPPESAAVIEWVCGDAPVPAGRTIPTPRLETRVPAHLLPSVCRKGGSK